MSRLISNIHNSNTGLEFECFNADPDSECTLYAQLDMSFPPYIMHPITLSNIIANFDVHGFAFSVFLDKKLCANRTKRYQAMLAFCLYVPFKCDAQLCFFFGYVTETAGGTGYDIRRLRFLWQTFEFETDATDIDFERYDWIPMHKTKRAGNPIISINRSVQWWQCAYRSVLEQQQQPKEQPKQQQQTS